MNQNTSPSRYYDKKYNDQYIPENNSENVVTTAQFNDSLYEGESVPVLNHSIAPTFQQNPIRVTNPSVMIPHPK